jgi:putative Holliday junction resolvase
MKPRKIIAVDLGEKNVGVAVSDDLRLTAQGLTCLRRTDDEKLLSDLCQLIREHKADLVVVGFPRNMSGDVGPKGREAMQFADRLREVSGGNVSLWDERLTTRLAERSMLEGDLSRKKRKKHRDIIAAQLILQSFLDSLPHHTDSS